MRHPLKLYEFSLGSLFMYAKPGFEVISQIEFKTNLTDLPYHLVDLSNFLNHPYLLEFSYLLDLTELPDHPGLPIFLNHTDLHTTSPE